MRGVKDKLKQALSLAPGLLGLAVAVWVGQPCPGQQPPALAPSTPRLSNDQAATDRLADWLLGPLLIEVDPDGPIGTDRPSFTRANTVVPRGRLQFESGYGYERDLTRLVRTESQDFPELATRFGLTDRVELRTFWTGQTYSRQFNRITGVVQTTNGPSDMEIGLKSQLWVASDERSWIPTTALVTSVHAPVGGRSAYSSQTVNADIDLLYGWDLTDSLKLAGSTGYLGLRTRRPGLPADSHEQFHQSIVTYYRATSQTILFYEWYSLLTTNAADNRPRHFMDGGLLFRPKPNIQLDARAGFGLGDRPTDFFGGVGLSIRF